MADVSSKESPGACSANLPEVDFSMVLNFFFTSSAKNVAETRINTYSQNSYENFIVRCVCAKRQGFVCTLKAQVYIEQNGLQKKYCTVVSTVNENKKVISNLRCTTCFHGGCEHALAFLKYLQKIENDRAGSRLTGSLEQMTISDTGNKILKQKTSNKGCNQKQDLNDGVSNTKEKQFAAVQNKENTKDAYFVSKENQSKTAQIQREKNHVLSRAENTNSEENMQQMDTTIPNTEENQIISAYDMHVSSLIDLSLNEILTQCFLKGIRDVEGFLAFAKIKMQKRLCKLAEKKTRLQSKSSLWRKLRHGRITASKAYEASKCRTENGSLVKVILGEAYEFENPFMKRGRELEDEVFKEVLKLGYKIKKCGIFLHADYPYLGASPDGIGNDFILEIKCPSSQKTFGNYLQDGKITARYKAQVLLQMFVTGKEKGLFCVADHDFENNKKMYIDWVNYDKDEIEMLIANVWNFWKNNIFPKLSSKIK